MVRYEEWMGLNSLIGRRYRINPSAELVDLARFHPSGKLNANRFWIDVPCKKGRRFKDRFIANKF